VTASYIICAVIAAPALTELGSCSIPPASDCSSSCRRTARGCTSRGSHRRRASGLPRLPRARNSDCSWPAARSSAGCSSRVDCSSSTRRRRPTRSVLPDSPSSWRSNGSGGAVRRCERRGPRSSALRAANKAGQGPLSLPRRTPCESSPGARRRSRPASPDARCIGTWCRAAAPSALLSHAVACR